MDIGDNFHRFEQGVIREISEIEKFTIKKPWIILGSIILIILIFGGIYFFTQPNTDIKLLPLDVVVSNSTGLNSNIYYEGEHFFILNGWESKLKLNEKEDRLFGKEQYKEIAFDDNGVAYTVISTERGIILEPLTTNPEKTSKIGWFTKPEQISIEEQAEGKEKQIKILLSSDEINSKINYYLFKYKPYFKTEFLTQIENNELEDFAYGLILKDYDIYLPNSTILKNDNKLIEEGKTVDIILKENNQESTNVSKGLLESVSTKVDTSRQVKTRTGSTYETKSPYQIFYNSDKDLAIITYSPETLYYKNSFYWNVYWIYVPHLGNGTYPPIYTIIIENPNLTYDEDAEDWHIESKQYTGNTKDYIDQVVWEIESGEAGKFNIKETFNNFIGGFKK
jgi:hypothetical protein